MRPETKQPPDCLAAVAQHSIYADSLHAEELMIPPVCDHVHVISGRSFAAC
jgi:hypothetical protein